MYKDKDYYTLVKMPNGYWYYYCYDEYGKRLRKSTSQRTKGRAIKVIMERINDGILICPSDGIRKSITFGEYAEPFFVHGRCPIEKYDLAHKGTPNANTMKNRKSIKDSILIPDLGKTELVRMTPKMLDEWLVSLPSKKGLKNSSVNTARATLQLILKNAVSDGILTSNPISEVKTMVVNSEKSVFSQEQIVKLLGKPWENVFAYGCCLLSATTGMRASEVLAFRLSNINGSQYIVREQHDRRGFVPTKNGKPRYVPLHPKVEAYLRMIAGSDDIVFTFDGKKPMAHDTLRTALESKLKELGMDGIGLTFHSFRHYFNTTMLTKGISESITRQIVGHSSVEMSEHYLHLEGREVESVNRIQDGILGDLNI